ncbi:hypothetical protein OE88DRAFT_791061 [Heliocybe sulcata]|uniref:Uncharacterized protein n=1 Tax=Heliocybe sulcata TaxID=5364 RepID=A0A5C3MPK5_9AGAM|nr:hypothetical protein OE88DRAFT_791061 [Heliocybe sulcata]
MRLRSLACGRFPDVIASRMAVPTSMQHIYSIAPPAAPNKCSSLNCLVSEHEAMHRQTLLVIGNPAWVLYGCLILYVVFRRIRNRKYNTRHLPYLQNPSCYGDTNLMRSKPRQDLNTRSGPKKADQYIVLREHCFIPTLLVFRSDAVDCMSRFALQVVVSDRLAISLTSSKIPSYPAILERLVGKGLLWVEGDDHRRVNGHGL